jgi:hypothetical protein
MTNDRLILQVSKLDAAQRQLQIAIRMWFYDADPVSTHTLAYAAFEVIRDVSRARNPRRPEILLESIGINSKEVEEFIRTLKNTANRLKHANRDPHQLVNFAPGFTQVLIFYAIHGIELCREMPAYELLAFQLWLQIANPELMLEQTREVIAHSGLVEHLESFKAGPKHEFFESFLTAVRAKRD